MLMKRGVDGVIAQPFQYLARLVLVAVAYWVAARLSLNLALVHGQVTPLWPPTGIALVAILVLGRGVAPGIGLAAFAVNLPLGPSPLGAAFIAVGNTLAPLLSAELLARAGFRRELDRMRDAVVLIVLGALVGMMVSATVGTLVLVLSGAVPATRLAATWAVWWTGDAMGVLLVAPFLLNLLPYPGRRPLGWSGIAEVAILAGGRRPRDLHPLPESLSPRVPGPTTDHGRGLALSSSWGCAGSAGRIDRRDLGRRERQRAIRAYDAAREDGHAAGLQREPQPGFVSPCLFRRRARAERGHVAPVPVREPRDSGQDRRHQRGSPRAGRPARGHDQLPGAAGRRQAWGRARQVDRRAQRDGGQGLAREQDHERPVGRRPDRGAAARVQRKHGGPSRRGLQRGRAGEAARRAERGGHRGDVGIRSPAGGGRLPPARSDPRQLDQQRTHLCRTSAPPESERDDGRRTGRRPCHRQWRRDVRERARPRLPSFSSRQRPCLRQRAGLRSRPVCEPAARGSQCGHADARADGDRPRPA